MTDPIRVGPDSPVGSERLAAALASGDAEEIGRALRHDVVVVPLLRGEDGTPQIRIFQPQGAGAELALFSSSATLAQFLAGDAAREFDVPRGADLADFLAQYRGMLSRVVFDPAGPHPVAAPVDAVIEALHPRPGDDDVAWIAGTRDAPATPAPPGEVPTGTGRTVDFRLAMPLGTWDRAVPADLTPRRSAVLAGFVRRVRRARPPQRDAVAAWVEQTAREWAADPTAREVDVTAAGRGDDALVILAARFWREGGAVDATPVAGDRVDSFDAGGAVPGARIVRTVEAALPGRSAVAVDYRLPFRDGAGTCLVRFLSPATERLDDILRLCDPVVLGGGWVERSGPDAV